MLINKFELEVTSRAAVECSRAKPFDTKQPWRWLLAYGIYDTNPKLG